MSVNSSGGFISAGAPPQPPLWKALTAFADSNPGHHLQSIKARSNSHHPLAIECLLHVHYVPGPKTTL